VPNDALSHPRVKFGAADDPGVTDLTIRRYQPGDAERLRALHEAAMRDADAYDPDVPDDDLDAIEATYFDSGGEFLVGTVGGDVVAMGALRPAADRTAPPFDTLRDPAAEVTRMRVDPDHQRQGFGRRLLAALEDRAREMGYRDLFLDTQAHQQAARCLYESSGFEQERVVEVEAFGDTFELLLYRKPLDD
jgi:GNAT superfamily N-acetyltransferase